MEKALHRIREVAANPPRPPKGSHCGHARALQPTFGSDRETGHRGKAFPPPPASGSRSHLATCERPRASLRPDRAERVSSNRLQPPGQCDRGVPRWRCGFGLQSRPRRSASGNRAGSLTPILHGVFCIPFLGTECGSPPSGARAILPGVADDFAFHHVDQVFRKDRGRQLLSTAQPPASRLNQKQFPACVLLG